MTATISVFIKPFEDEFGWLRADISFAYTLLSAGAALGGLVVGWAFDRIDTRIIVVFGAVVMAAGFVALSRSSDLATIQHIYLAIGVAGFACLYTCLIAIVGLWFDRGRGLAMGIVTAGGAIGQGVTPLLVQPMIAAFGWRNTCLMLGLGFLVRLAPVMLLVTKPCERTMPQAAQAAAKPWPLPPAISIGWLGLAGLFCCASMAVPLVHLVSLLTDRGEPIGVSGSLLFVAMLAASVGRVVIGMICDRIGALGGYALAVALQSVTVYWFVPLQSHVALYVLAVAFGFGFGGVMTGAGAVRPRRGVAAHRRKRSRAGRPVRLGRNGTGRISGRLLLRRDREAMRSRSSARPLPVSSISPWSARWRCTCAGTIASQPGCGERASHEMPWPCRCVRTRRPAALPRDAEVTWRPTRWN